MNIKTEDLIANTEQKINLEGGTHFKVKNISDTTIYISQKSPVTPKSDGVKSIQPNTEDILTDVAIYSIQNGIGNYRGTIYALATENCTIELEATNSQNFKSTGKGGGSGGYTKEEVDTLLSAKANSAHTHVISDTTGLQSALNGKANSTHTHAIADITNLQSTLDNKASKIGGSKRYYVGRLIDTSAYYKVFTMSCVDVQTVYTQFVIHGIEHAMEIRGEVSLRYTSSTNVDMYATIYSSVFSASTCDLYYKKVSAGEYDLYIKPAGWIGAIDCYIDNAVAIQNTSLQAYTTWDGLNRISTTTTGTTTTDDSGMTAIKKESSKGSDIAIPDTPWIVPIIDGVTATSRAMVNFSNKTLLLHAQITFNLSSTLASGTAVLKVADDINPKPVEFVQWCPVVKGTVAHAGLYHRANHTFTTLSDLPAGETVIQLMVLVNTATT